MSVEQVGPGGVSNSYGVRVTNVKQEYDNEKAYKEVFIPEGTVPLTATVSSSGGVVVDAGGVKFNLSKMARPATGLYALADADIASRPPRLRPVDSVPLRVFNADDVYGYGHGTPSSRIMRVDLTTRAVSSGYDFGTGFSITDIFAGQGALFVSLLETATNKSTLWRSSDRGATFAKVHNIGTSYDGTTHSAEVKILMRGLDFGELGGVPAIMFGTYNYTTGAPYGTTQDENYIAVSMDNGITWMKLNSWNLSGKHSIDHIHFVRWDKYRRNWWIGTGDMNNLCEMICRWDGVTPWPGDKTPKEMASVPGFWVGQGSQRFRAVDILLDEDWCYTMTDTVSNNEGGIWRFRPDMTEHHRVDHQIRGREHEGWSAIRCNDGTLLWIDEPKATSTGTQRHAAVYGSADGNRWFDIGHLHLTGTAVSLPRGFFQDKNNLIWISVDNEAGKGLFSTTIYKLAGKFIEDRPDNLAPAYFVDFASGNDTNDGYGAVSAWKTARNALAGNKVTHGAIIVLSEGTSLEAGVTSITYGATANAAHDTTQRIQFSGQGRDKTTVAMSSGYGWYDSSSEKTYSIELTDFTFRQNVATNALLWDVAAQAAPATWTLRDMRVGSRGLGSSHVIYVNAATVKCHRTNIENLTEAVKYCLYASGTGQIKIYSCRVIGGRGYQTGGGKITAWHTDFDYCGNVPVEMAAASTVAADVKNCTFGSSTSVTPIVNNSVTVVLTSADVAGCSYAVPVSANVPPPAVPVSGPLDRNPETLVPYDWAAIASAGQNSVGLGWDYYGNPYRKSPAIGPCEVVF